MAAEKAQIIMQWEAHENAAIEQIVCSCGYVANYGNDVLVVEHGNEWQCPDKDCNVVIRFVWHGMIWRELKILEDPNNRFKKEEEEFCSDCVHRAKPECIDNKECVYEKKKEEKEHGLK